MELREDILSRVIRKRPSHSHKGTYGRVLLIGGNQQYGGAIILSAAACVNSGAGLVSVACHVSNHAPLHARLPEAMVIDYEDFETVQAAIASADVIAIGSGLGLDRIARVLLDLVLTTVHREQLVVIDGSAITLLSDTASVGVAFPERVVYTPHEMEWQRLSGLAIEKQTVEASREAAHQLGSFVVAKSDKTKIFQPDSDEVAVVTNGTPAMATGGMGDTLAGMIAGFLAQFHDVTFDTICAATYLHSKIAHSLAETHYVVLPSELIANISLEMKRWEA
jgi:hydroxyethylthiazole kinase-like uncharacterized protein yjeF